jgi:hypothetical protein
MLLVPVLATSLGSIVALASSPVAVSAAPPSATRLELQQALPRASKIGSGWQIEQRPRVVGIDTKSLSACDSSFVTDVGPGEAVELFSYLPTTSQLRITTLTARDSRSGSQLWSLLKTCDSSKGISFHELPGLGTSTKEFGGYSLQPEEVGGQDLEVVYVAQASNLIGVYTFFGSGGLKFASQAIERATASLHR